MCYADDSTLSVSHKDKAGLKSVIHELYKKVSDYMAMNMLKLNSGKTHFMLLKTNGEIDAAMELDTGFEIIRPSNCEKLLGVYISNDLKWDTHLRMHSNSVVRILTSRLNALWKVSQFASFKTRKIVADGIFTSSLIYVIQLWGGCNQSLISCLQVIQNKAARSVTKLGLRTPVKTLLEQCGWMSVRQLVVYHCCLSIFKIRYFGKPIYFYRMLCQTSSLEDEPISNRTRLHSTGGVRLENVKSCLYKQSFYYNSLKNWNSLPQNVRQSGSLAEFKKNLKIWIRQNILIR